MIVGSLPPMLEWDRPAVIAEREPVPFFEVKPPAPPQASGNDFTPRPLSVEAGLFSPSPSEVPEDPLDGAGYWRFIPHYFSPLAELSMPEDFVQSHFRVDLSYLWASDGHGLIVFLAGDLTRCVSMSLWMPPVRPCAEYPDALPATPPFYRFRSWLPVHAPVEALNHWDLFPPQSAEAAA